jgi:hypothetical protein
MGVDNTGFLEHFVAHHVVGKGYNSAKMLTVYVQMMARMGMGSIAT